MIALTVTTAELTYARSKGPLNAGGTETVLTEDGALQTVKASIPSANSILRHYLHLKITAP